MMIWAFISIHTMSVFKEINQVLHFRDKHFTSCDGLKFWDSTRRGPCPSTQKCRGGFSTPD